MFADLLDPETGVLALEPRYPRCPICDGQKRYDERQYIRLFGHCEDCEIRMTPAILRKEGKK